MDLRKIKKLIDLLEESNLAELEIKERVDREMKEKAARELRDREEREARERDERARRDREDLERGPYDSVARVCRPPLHGATRSGGAPVGSATNRHADLIIQLTSFVK